MIDNLKSTINSLGLRSFIFVVVCFFMNILLFIFMALPKGNFLEISFSFMTNPIHLVILFLSIFSSVSTISFRFKNQMIILRHESYVEYLKKMIKKIAIFISLFIIMDFICILIISIFKCNMNFKVNTHFIYDIPFSIYILFFIIRETILLILLSIVVLYLTLLTKKNLALVLSGLISIIPIFHVHSDVINSLMKIPLIFTDYFIEILYSNIFLEISGTIIQFLILFFVISLLEKIMIKKGDII